MKRGFTLIELLATIMLLALITSVGAYAVINFINSSNTFTATLDSNGVTIGQSSIVTTALWRIVLTRAILCELPPSISSFGFFTPK